MEPVGGKLRAKRLFEILIVVSAMCFPYALAHGAQAKAGESKSTQVLGSQLTTILEFGLAGGALGLSTLSFYGRPQDKLSHIPVGLALGIFAGAIFSTSRAVTDPASLTAQTEPDFLERPMLPPLAFQWTVDF